MHACTYTHVHVSHTHKHVHAYTHRYTYICSYPYPYAYTHIHLHKLKHTAHSQYTCCRQARAYADKHAHDTHECTSMHGKNTYMHPDCKDVITPNCKHTQHSNTHALHSVCATVSVDRQIDLCTASRTTYTQPYARLQAVHCQLSLGGIKARCNKVNALTNNVFHLLAKRRCNGDAKNNISLRKVSIYCFN